MATVKKKPAAKKTAVAAAKKPAAKKPVTPARMHGTRGDKGTSIEPYLAALDGEIRAVSQALVDLVRGAVPDAVAEIKWGMPVFSRGKLFAYVSAGERYVRFGFYGWPELLTGGRTEGTGRMPHVKIATVKDMDAPLLTRWVTAVARAAGGP